MRKLTAAVMLGLALTACEARLEMNVNRDGSGLFGFTFLAEKDFIDAMKGFGGDPFEEMKKDLANDPVAWEVGNVSEKGQSGIRATFPFDHVDDLKKKLDSLASENDGNDPFVDGDLTLEPAGSGWRFEAKAAAPSSSAMLPQPPGPPGAPEGFEQPDIGSGLDSMLGNMRFVFRVTLPGTATQTNADSVSKADGGTRFEWTFSARNSDGPRHLTATTTGAGAPGGGGGLPVVPFAIATLLAGGVGAALFLRRPKAPTVPVLEGFPVPAPDPVVANGPSEHVPTTPSEQVSVTAPAEPSE